jgi:PAS domain S-box-containing protein
VPKAAARALEIADTTTPYHELVDALPCIVWIRDADGRLRYVNDYWYSYSGQSREEAFRPGSWVETVHPEDRIHTVATFRDALANNTAFDCEHRVRNAATGEYRWFHSCAIGVRDEQGQPLRWIGNAVDIDDFKRMQESLRRAEKRGHESVAVLAHELRNPLAALTASVDQLRSVASAGQQNSPVLATIERQIERLRLIVDDVLEVSRLERGKPRLRASTIDLAAVVREVLADSRATLEAGDVELIDELALTTLPLVGDASRLAQVLTNLLENARKYTPSGGWVRVSLDVDRLQREAVLRVSDSGTGIEPALLGSVFEPFRQSEAGAGRSGGLGLGLAIVHRLVELHGGRVLAYSDGRNQGTTITVHLPMAFEPPAET